MNLKKINLGCGKRFHPDWVNIDFASTGPGVVAHNLLSGIPVEDNSGDVLYHSHVLEHFTREDGRKFIQECFRVLKPGGIIRIAVPDLEQIARLYLQKLEGAYRGDNQDMSDYDWMMLELYDQTVRSVPGGEMAKYFQQDIMPSEKFVFERMGDEGRKIRDNYLRNRNALPVVPKSNPVQPKSFFEKLFSSESYRNFLKYRLFGKELAQQREDAPYIKLGRFRKGGEIHQWMYDRYSLGKLLEESGFKDVRKVGAFESKIPRWNSYELDGKDNVVFKPDSLFMEAQKPTGGVNN